MDIFRHFKVIGNEKDAKKYMTDPVKLIRDNFMDHMSRHLMVITQSPEQAFKHL